MALILESHDTDYTNIWEEICFNFKNEENYQKSRDSMTSKQKMIKSWKDFIVFANQRIIALQNQLNKTKCFSNLSNPIKKHSIPLKLI